MWTLVLSIRRHLTTGESAFHYCHIPVGQPITTLAEAEDAAHEAFARVLTSPRSFLHADDAKRWLRVAALNVARTRYRRRLFDRLVRSGRVEITPAAVPRTSGDRGRPTWPTEPEISPIGRLLVVPVG